MPGMGGAQCFKELITLDPTARVIIATGYSIDTRVSECLHLGAMAYVSKPYQLVDMLKEVRKVLDR